MGRVWARARSRWHNRSSIKMVNCEKGDHRRQVIRCFDSAFDLILWPTFPSFFSFFVKLFATNRICAIYATVFALHINCHIIFTALRGIWFWFFLLEAHTAERPSQKFVSSHLNIVHSKGNEKKAKNCGHAVQQRTRARERDALVGEAAASCWAVLISIHLICT